MSEIPKRPSTTVLSRFFDNNVRLVAGVCSKCYLEGEEDVKLIAVNKRFLKQIDKQVNKKLKTTSTSLHDDKDDDNNTCQNYYISSPTSESGKFCTKTPEATTSTDDDYPLITITTSRQMEPRLNCHNKSNITHGSETANLYSIKSKNFLEIDNKSRYFDNNSETKETISNIQQNHISPNVSNTQGNFLLSQDFNVLNTENILYIQHSELNVLNNKITNETPNMDFKNNPNKINLSRLSLSSSQKPSWLALYNADNAYNIKSEIDIKDENGNSSLTNIKPKCSINFAKLFKKDKSTWIPPRSPHNLIEESFYHDPWSLLIATIFLNKTSCRCARPRVEEFLHDFPGASDVLKEHPSKLEKYFLDLGLHRKRAEQVWRMSYDYVYKNWKNPRELYGIGKYGEDAYRLFILGDLDVEPSDRFLKIYRNWARIKRKEDMNAKCPDL